MRATLRALLFLALLIPAGGILAAQHHGLRPVERNSDGDGSGFWAIVGLSRGNERFRFDTDSSWSDPFQANSFLLSAGGRVSPDFTVGG